MAENLTFFGDLADDFDALVVADEKLLDNYVEGEGYSLSSMMLASSAIAFMQFARTFTDMGRLGSGVVIEGGFKGFAKDGLRVLNLVGTAGGRQALEHSNLAEFRTSAEQARGHHLACKPQSMSACYQGGQFPAGFSGIILSL
jgi:hypothetical protein